MFPDTPKTLLRNIAEFAQGDDAAEWAAFVELYEMPLRHFVRLVDARLSAVDVDDAVEDVFVRLVDVLRKGQVDRSKGKFRSYLAAMTRRILIDRYRALVARPDLSARVEGWNDADSEAFRERTGCQESAQTLDPGTLVEIKWRMARHAAALEHVLTKTAAAEQSKAIYRALLGLDPCCRNLTPREIAKRFGVSYDVVKQVKSRLDRAVEAIESRLEF